MRVQSSHAGTQEAAHRQGKVASAEAEAEAEGGDPGLCEYQPGLTLLLDPSTSFPSLRYDQPNLQSFRFCARSQDQKRDLVPSLPMMMMWVTCS